MSVATLTKSNFDEVITNNPIVIIDFWAEWCGPCKAFAPTFAEVAQRHPEVFFAKVDIEQEQELAADFNIRSIPLLMVLRDNIVVFSQAGALPASALEELIQQAKALDMAKIRNDIESQQNDND